MFGRKLSALQYDKGAASVFDINNPKMLGELIVWLEDQKIRHYKIDDRKKLRNLKNPQQWDEAFSRYLEELDCPIQCSDQMKCQVLDWILGYAIKLEYCDYNESNQNTLRDMTAENLRRGGSKSSKGIEALKNIDINSADFKAGLSSVCLLLEMPRHDNHLIMLQALALICKQRLSTQDPSGGDTTGAGATTGSRMQLSDVELGFKTNKEATEKAAKILRLLHVRELRELQSKIDEAIVACQNITADPRVDQRLGKIGR